MKSFLDRFKRRDPDERAQEVASERIGKAGTPGDKPAPTIHVLALGAESKAPDSLTPSPAAASAASVLATVADNEVRLELSDFLHRIPQNLLRPGPHDVSMELHFEVAELSSLIARGQTSINLAELYARAPGIFRAEVRVEDNVEVRFPWQKLMSIIKGVASDPVGKTGISQAAADALAQKLRSRRPTRNISTGSPSTCVAAKSQPTAAQGSATAEAGKAGARGRQPAWVNKSTSENVPSDALAGSPRSVDVEARATREAAAPSPDGSPLPDAQCGVTQEELIRDRDAANVKYEEAKADLQRQMAALSEEQQTELLQCLSNESSEDATRLIANREAVQKELAARAAELEQLRNEIAAQKKSSDERLAAVSAERETLARERDALKKDLGAKDADFEALKAQLAALTHSGDEKGAALTDEHVRIAAELQRAREELTARDEKIAFQQELSAKSAEDAVKLVSEREVLRKEVAVKTSDLETTKIDLALLRQDAGEKHAAIAAERDKVLANLKRTREELAGKVEQSELQQSLVTRSGEDFAKANADREALRNELEARTGELDSLKKALAGLQKSSDEKAAEFAQEQAKTMGELEQTRRDLAAKVDALESLKSEAAAKKKR